MTNYSTELKNIVKLTPRGLKSVKRPGRKKMIANISEALQYLPNDDLANLDVLTGFMVDQFKHPDISALLIGLSEEGKQYMGAVTVAMLGPDKEEFARAQKACKSDSDRLSKWLVKHKYLTPKLAMTSSTAAALKSGAKIARSQGGEK